jgi:hypothetical protein
VRPQVRPEKGFCLPALPQRGSAAAEITGPQLAAWTATVELDWIPPSTFQILTIASPRFSFLKPYRRKTWRCSAWAQSPILKFDAVSPFFSLV